MSTHRHSLRGYRNTCVPLFLISCGLMLVLQLCLASAAFASVHRSLAVLSGTPIPTDAAGAPTDKSFALARVSVVRLLVSYTSTDGNNTPVASCSGLGVLIKSLSASNTPPATPMPNDWVLTESSLVHPTQPLCASGSTGKISQVQIDFNTTYNSKKQVTVKLDSNSTPPVSNPITCFDPANCNNGPALITFQGEEAPFVDLASSSANTVSANTDHAVIALTDASGKLPTARENAADFLTPQPLDPNTGSQLEAGTPLIDANGRLTGLHSANASSWTILSDTSLLMQKIPSSPSAGNTVNTNWNKGIDAYYAQKYADALADFRQVVKDNPNFQSANDFANFASKAQHPVSLTATPVPQGNVVIPGINLSVELWQLSILVLLFLILLFLLMWLFLRSRMERHRAFKAEVDDAGRRAATVTQELEVMEAAQRDWIERHRTSEQSTFPVQQQVLQDKAVVRKLARNLLCPRCGELINRDAKYCPNCRLTLTSSESGQHLRIPLSTSSAPSAKTLKPRVEFDATDIRADINAWQLREQKGD